MSYSQRKDDFTFWGDDCGDEVVTETIRMVADFHQAGPASTRLSQHTSSGSAFVVLHLYGARRLI